VLSWCLFACPPSHDAQVAASAGHVARAIEALRSADNDAKRAPLAELGKVACGSPEVCAVRDLCVEAYKLHVDAVETTKLAKDAAANGKMPRVTLLLIDAQKKLSLAGLPVANCVDREAELRRRFKL